MINPIWQTTIFPQLCLKSLLANCIKNAFYRIHEDKNHLIINKFMGCCSCGFCYTKKNTAAKCDLSQQRLLVRWWAGGLKVPPSRSDIKSVNKYWNKNYRKLWPLIKDQKQVVQIFKMSNLSVGRYSSAQILRPYDVSIL